MVVLAILGLLAVMVAPRVITLFQGAKNKIAAQSIAGLGQGLEIYKLDVGTYPSPDQGLQALLAQPTGTGNWHGPYVKSINDPWNRPFVYTIPSQRPGHDYDICSYGESGQPGGSGTEAPICND